MGATPEQWTCPQCGLTMDARKCRKHSKRTGEHCGDWATVGLDCCRRHGGATKKAKAKAERNVARVEAERQLARLEVAPRKVSPTDALLDVVHSVAGWVDVLEGLVTADGADGLTQWGMAGRTPSAYWSMLVEQRKLLVQAAQACARAGIEERQVQLAEAQGRMLAEVVRTIVTGLGRDLDDPEVRQVVEPALRLVHRAA